MKIIEGDKLTKKFGGLYAVREVDFHLQQGEILGLIGPNGAGKTTLINLISGLYQPTSGDILYKGKSLIGTKAHVRATTGIVRTFQIVRVFPKLTVLDNVRAALVKRKGRNAFRVACQSLLKRGDDQATGKKGTERAMELLERVGLGAYRDELAENLPYAYTKRLEIARALAIRPEVLLLDEPSAGLNPIEQDDQIALINHINRQGITILIIEHVMKVIMDISHRIIVLHHGKKIAEGIPEEIYQNKDVVEAYLGGEVRVKH